MDAPEVLAEALLHPRLVDQPAHHQPTNSPLNSILLPAFAGSFFGFRFP